MIRLHLAPDEELAAVITAAIAACLGTQKFRVVHIARAEKSWDLLGKQERMIKNNVV